MTDSINPTASSAAPLQTTPVVPKDDTDTKLNDKDIMRQLALLYVAEAKVTRRYLSFLVETQNDLNNLNITYQNQVDALPARVQASIHQNMNVEHKDFEGGTMTPVTGSAAAWVDDDGTAKGKIDAIIKQMTKDALAHGHNPDISAASIKSYLKNINDRLKAARNPGTSIVPYHKYCEIVPQSLRVILNPYKDPDTRSFIVGQELSAIRHGMNAGEIKKYHGLLFNQYDNAYRHADIAMGYISNNPRRNMEHVMQKIQQKLDAASGAHVDFNRYTGTVLHKDAALKDGTLAQSLGYYYDPSKTSTDPKAIQAQADKVKDDLEGKMKDVNNRMELVNEKVTRTTHYAEQYLETASSLYVNDYREAKNWLAGIRFYS